MVEKSDSVSWVLEIDESPMAVASRMLRRANSLRGVPSKKKSQREQQSLTLPARTKKKCSSEAPSTPEPQTDEGVAAQAPETPSSVDCDLNRHSDDDRIVAAATSDSVDGSVITDISSFFDFLHDPDFDTDLLVPDEPDLRNHFYMDDKALPSSPFSNSSSTDSSLDLETYNHEMKSFTRFTWTSSSTTPTNGNAAGDPTSPRDGRRIDSSSVTDSDDESDSFADLASSLPTSGLESGVVSKTVDSVQSPE